MHLTPRQLEILNFCWDGLTNKEIAQKIYRSHKTVELHLHSLYKKAKVNNKVSLCRWALETGIIKIKDKT